MLVSRPDPGILQSSPNSKDLLYVELQALPRDRAGALSSSLSARGQPLERLWEPSLTVQLPLEGLRAQEAAFLIFFIFWQIKKHNKL